MDNLIDLNKRRPLGKKVKEWQKPAEEPKNKQVQLVAVEMATLLYNLVQSNLQMLERLEEITDMLTHTEYQVDMLRKEVDELKVLATLGHSQNK
jgi:hypothetical protein